MVGMRTSMAMNGAPGCGPTGTWQLSVKGFGLSQGSTGGPAGSFRRWRSVLPRAVLPGDPHFFLAHLTVHDTERPELGLVRLPRGNQHVVGSWLAGVGDVGAGRVGRRGGMGVVDDDRLLVAVVHFSPDGQLLHRVEPVERRGSLGVQ